MTSIPFKAASFARRRAEAARLTSRIDKIVDNRRHYSTEEDEEEEDEDDNPKTWRPPSCASRPENSRCHRRDDTDDDEGHAGPSRPYQSRGIPRQDSLEV